MNWPVRSGKGAWWEDSRVADMGEELWEDDGGLELISQVI